MSATVESNLPVPERIRKISKEKANGGGVGQSTAQSNTDLTSSAVESSLADPERIRKISKGTANGGGVGQSTAQSNTELTSSAVESSLAVPERIRKISKGTANGGGVGQSTAQSNTDLTSSAVESSLAVPERIRKISKGTANGGGVGQSTAQSNTDLTSSAVESSLAVPERIRKISKGTANGGGVGQSTAQSNTDLMSSAVESSLAVPDRIRKISKGTANGGGVGQSTAQSNTDLTSSAVESSLAVPERIRKISKETATGGHTGQSNIASASSTEEDSGKGASRKMSTSVRKISTVRKFSVAGPDWTRKISAESNQRKISVVSRSDSDVQRKMSRKISRYNRESSEENTLRFVYSEAVETAIRTNFRSSAFRPISRIARGIESHCEILKLPEIFQDWISVRKYRKSNISCERSWRIKEERRRSTIYEDSCEDSGLTRLPKVQHLKILRVNKKRGSIDPGSSRLPPVLQVTQADSPTGSEGKIPQPDLSFTF